MVAYCCCMQPTAQSFCLWSGFSGDWFKPVKCFKHLQTSMRLLGFCALPTVWSWSSLEAHFGSTEDGLERFLQQAASVELVKFAETAEVPAFCEENQQLPDGIFAPMLWRLAETLQRCGVRALPHEWLSHELQWQGLQQQVSESLGALADVRSDDASVICRRFRATHLQSANGSTEKRWPRCPRCGKAIGQAKEMQSRLQVFQQDLNKSYSESGPDVLIEMTAACKEELQIGVRFPTADSAAMLAEIESLECNSCQLQAFAAVDSNLWGALALLHCAPQLEATSLEPRLQRAMEILEFNLWKGVAFPSLHEAVSKEIFQLRLSKRFQNFESSRFCTRKQSVTLAPGGGTDFWEEEERQMLSQEPAELSIGYFRLAQRLETNTMTAQQVPQALALSAFWLREGNPSNAAVRAAQLLVEAAVQSAGRLSPGLQLLVLQTCLEASRPFNGRPLSNDVLKRLNQLGQMPVTLPSPVSLGQMRQIAPYVDRLYWSFGRRLQTLSSQARISIVSFRFI